MFFGYRGMVIPESLAGELAGVKPGEVGSEAICEAGKAAGFDLTIVSDEEIAAAHEALLPQAPENIEQNTSVKVPRTIGFLANRSV